MTHPNDERDERVSTAGEYITHYFEMGHDRGDPAFAPLGPRGDARKLAARIIDAVVKSPCVVEVRFFSRPVEAERLEIQVAEMLSTATSSPTPAESDDYVAWCCYAYDESGCIQTIKTCDSDTTGAFKVYRHPAASAESVICSCGHERYNHYKQFGPCDCGNCPQFAEAASAPTQRTPVAGERATRFKVGDKLRNVHASYLPIATVTEITERGFRYELERPMVISPRLGTQTGGESYDDSQWEILAPDTARLAAEEIGKYLDAFTPLTPRDGLIRIFENTIKRHFAATPADNDAERLRWLLKRIITDLPQNRDWLDPDVEREAREATATKGDR